jgi:hypothetical protein
MNRFKAAQRAEYDRRLAEMLRLKRLKEISTAPTDLLDKG